MAFKRGTALAGLITGALALLGGVWFPVTLLPGAVRAVAPLLPFTWGWRPGAIACSAGTWMCCGWRGC